MPDDLLPLSDPGAVFAVLFLLVLIGPIVAQWLRLPAIIGLIVAGMLVGPNVLGVLDENTFIETIGYVGLLYLMFEGGLDLDLDGFRARRRESIVFGVLTFVFPMVIVTSVALALGLGVLASVIIGSAFTSHTLLSYPTISRLDLTRIPSVTATLGATLLATTGALLVLAIAVAAAGGDTGVWYWVRFLAGLVIYLLVMLLVVPRFTRWFFTGLAQNRQVRMTYLLSGMGIAAVVAGMVGIEPIVGAFIAGLAFNRFVPHGTAIEARVKILGESVFIPAFLISTGMLLDPVSLVADPRTLLLGGAFTAALVASKLTASELVGRLMRVSLPERGVMFSLSVGQAAGALAAVVIADELGLVSPAVVNAAVLVILLSALIAGVTADRYAPRIEVRQSRTRAIGNRVVVPVAHPRTVTPLVRVAAQLAADDSGAVVAVNVLPLNATDDELRSHRSLAAEAERVALAAGSEVTTSVRIDASTVGGVLHTVAEQGGTALVMGWKGFANRREGFFGSVIDQVVDQSTVPVLVCRPGDDDRTRRVVVVVTEGDVEPGGERGVRLAFEVGSRIARQAEVDLVVFSEVAREAAVPHLTGRGVDDVRVTAVEGLLGQLPSLLRPGDVVLTGMPPRTGRLGRGARRLARAAVGRTVIVVVPH